MIVKRADLEARLADIEAQVTDPRAGVWGPNTLTWRLDRDLINFAGGGRAALLQLAHPFVAQAIDDHSAAPRDPQTRFRRTFEQVFAMTFGDLDHAFSAARRVHGVHARVGGRLRERAGAHARGTRYAANDAAALFWVRATLIDTVIVVHDRLGGGLTAADKERYYQESKRGAALFGIPKSEIPPDYAAFRAYVRGRLADGTVAVTEAARAIANALLTPPTPALAPAMRLYRAVTAGLLPASVRRDFGFRFGAAERLSFRAAAGALAAAHRVTPERALRAPAYGQAARRVGQDDGGLLARAVERALARLAFWPDVPTG